MVLIRCFTKSLFFFLIGSSRDIHYKVPPMDLTQLEYFRTVKEITGRSMTFDPQLSKNRLCVQCPR